MKDMSSLLNNILMSYDKDIEANIEYLNKDYKPINVTLPLSQISFSRPYRIINYLPIEFTVNNNEEAQPFLNYIKRVSKLNQFNNNYMFDCKTSKYFLYNCFVAEYEVSKLGNEITFTLYFDAVKPIQEEKS